MAITTILTAQDLLGLSPQFQVSVNRLKEWIDQVNATVGANTAELRVVASTAAAKAIAAADRANLDVIFLADSGQALYFSAASSAAESLGPPITVIQPTAGTGRWLALALPPVASVGSSQLAAGAVNAAALGNASVIATKLGIAALTAPSGTAVGSAVYSIGFTIPNTAGTSNYTLPAVGLLCRGGQFYPDGTVGSTSSIQVQTAGGAGNVTEALDISSATAGLIKEFATVNSAEWNFAASAGIRVVTTGTNVGGTLFLDFSRSA